MTKNKIRGTLATSVYCACGAQWHGAWVAKAEPTIKEHLARLAKLRSTTCWSVPHDWFRRRHTCICAVCKSERTDAFFATHPNRRRAKSASTPTGTPR